MLECEYSFIQKSKTYLVFAHSTNVGFHSTDISPILSENWDFPHKLVCGRFSLFLYSSLAYSCSCKVLQAVCVASVILVIFERTFATFASTGQYLSGAAN